MHQMPILPAFALFLLASISLASFQARGDQENSRLVPYKNVLKQRDELIRSTQVVDADIPCRKFSYYDGVILTPWVLTDPTGKVLRRYASKPTATTLEADLYSPATVFGMESTALEDALYFLEPLAKECHPAPEMLRESNKIEIRWKGQEIGYGVFARAPIAKGEVISIYAGEVFSEEQVLDDGLYLLRLDEEKAIDAAAFSNRGRMINHSWLPNCRSSTYKEGKLYAKEKIPLMVLLADRPIAKGEELSWDYGRNYWKNLKKIPQSLYGEEAFMVGPSKSEIFVVTPHQPRKIFFHNDNGLEEISYLGFDTCSTHLITEFQGLHFDALFCQSSRDGKPGVTILGCLSYYDKPTEASTKNFLYKGSYLVQEVYQPQSKAVNLDAFFYRYLNLCIKIGGINYHTVARGFTDFMATGKLHYPEIFTAEVTTRIESTLTHSTSAAEAQGIIIELWQSQAQQ